MYKRVQIKLYVFERVFFSVFVHMHVFLSLLCVSVWSSVQMLGYHLYLEEKEQYFFSPHKQNISASGRIFPTDKTHPFLILIRLRFFEKKKG